MNEKNDENLNYNKKIIFDKEFIPEGEHIKQKIKIFH
jgi:hypothetical protein